LYPAKIPTPAITYPHNYNHYPISFAFCQDSEK